MSNELDANKITAAVITELAKTAAKTVYEKVVTYVSDVQKKDEVDFGYAFEDYLKYSKSVHEKIKTLLYRHVPKDIYDFYESIGLCSDEEIIINTSDINNVLSVGNKLIITGSGGVGKSVMMKHFFLNTLQNTGYIPILVELRGLNVYEEKDVNITDYIYNIMQTLKFKLDKKYFEYSLETGCYVILLDGFDEVKNDLSKKVTGEIFALSEKYPDNHYIISSRPLDEFMGWSQYEELQTMSLTKDQALSLISKLEYDETIKKNFRKELDEYLFDKYETFASNPLLLTIMLLTFENRASIPDKLNDFFEQAFTTLFHTHDATKGGYKRDTYSKLGYEDFKAVFAYFCFKSFFNSDYKFSQSKALEYIGLSKKKRIVDVKFNSSDYLKDLTNSVCMLVREGLDYRFSHRSFQEFFAALYTTQLDDDQQKVFLKLWLQDTGYRETSNYLDMLYELQPQRFVKNVITPAIRELEELYNQNGQSNEWLVDLMYDGVGVRRYKENDERCYLIVKEFYYHDMIARISKISKAPKKPTDEQKQKNIQKEENLKSILKKEYGLNKSVSLKDVKDKESVYDWACWVTERYNFALDYINSIDKSDLSQKENFSSIFDEL